MDQTVSRGGARRGRPRAEQPLPTQLVERPAQIRGQDRMDLADAVAGRNPGSRVKPKPVRLVLANDTKADHSRRDQRARMGSSGISPRSIAASCLPAEIRLLEHHGRCPGRRTLFPSPSSREAGPLLTNYTLTG